MSDDTIPKRCIVCGQNKHELEESCGDRRMYFVDETRTAVRCRQHAGEDIRDDYPYEPAFRQADLDRAVAAEREACAKLVYDHSQNAVSGWFNRDDLSELCDAIRARGGKLP